MSSQETAEGSAHVHAERIGGIGVTDVTLQSGVNVLAGRNASNRTSFLQALMAALGSDRASLKGDADEGVVELEIGEETYTRTLTRTGSAVRTDGDPYLKEAEPADLFAFLLEDTEARRAVARGDDLRELIMRPIDTGAIRSEIEELERRKRRLDDELDRLDELKGDLPALERRRSQLEERIEGTEADLADARADLETADATVDEQRERKEAFETTLSELHDLRSDHEDVRYRLESERDSLDALREEREEVEAALDDIPDAPGNLDDVDAELDRLRDHRRSLASTINQLQEIIQFNEEMLEGESPDVGDALTEKETAGDGGAITDQLVASRTVCWTCGSDVERDRIEDTLDRLRSFRQEKLDERTELTSELEDLKERKRKFEGQRDERERLRNKLSEIDAEIEDREATVQSLLDRKGDLEEEIEQLEADLEEAEPPNNDELIELNKRVNRLEFELGRHRDDLAEVVDEIESVESEVDRRPEVKADRESVNERLADLRTRIQQLENQAVEEFNEHMGRLLSILGYENIERIWIERTERDVREGRRTVTKGVFDLHVVRSTPSGNTYEDTIDHLSESEREVTGLVFALAGYLVHDLHETVPFMLLDSLEALDSERIATLVEYLSRYPDYLVVALLPEDAAAIDEDAHYITDV